MVGAPNSFAVLASATVLFFSCWRSMLTTPKDICGWWSMKRKTVSSALISDLARKVMVVSLYVWWWGLSRQGGAIAAGGGRGRCLWGMGEGGVGGQPAELVETRWASTNQGSVLMA